MEAGEADSSSEDHQAPWPPAQNHTGSDLSLQGKEGDGNWNCGGAPGAEMWERLELLGGRSVGTGDRGGDLEVYVLGKCRNHSWDGER